MVAVLLGAVVEVVDGAGTVVRVGRVVAAGEEVLHAAAARATVTSTPLVHSPRRCSRKLGTGGSVGADVRAAGILRPIGIGPRRGTN